MIGASMAVRPPRSRGPVLMMIDALRRIGGNLWMVDNAFTGAYIDITGTQPVTAYADLLGLATDRLGVLGPELAGLSTAWQSYGTGISLSGGQMTFTASPTGQFALRGTPLGANKTYALEITIPSITGGGLSLLLGGGAGVLNITTAGTYRGIYKATSVDGPYLLVASGTVTAVVTVSSCKEITGNHATQSAVASKPSVQRVPKRLGPNLVSNGDFSAGTTGWYSVAGGVLTASSGAMRVAANGSVTWSGQAEAVIQALNPLKQYQFSFDVLDENTGQGAGLFPVKTDGSPNGGLFSNGLDYYYPNTVGSHKVIFTSGTATNVTKLRLVAGSEVNASVLYDNIAVQEVLEWANVISFDGSNDFLQTGITTGNEGWVCAGVTFGGAAGANETVFANGAGRATMKGVWLLRLAGGTGSSAVRMGVGNGTAFTQVTGPFGLTVLGTPRVVEGGWAADSVMVGVDGQTTTAARAGDATPAPNTPLIGGYLSGVHHLAGPMHAFAYTPVLPSAADRDTIRNGIAALQGRTL